ncbi:MAG: hypothetical protein J0H46_19285 [Bacteroidetes bacterium]|nr:hypothetical protein [Bacteroidota bacterium]
MYNKYKQLQPGLDSLTIALTKGQGEDNSKAFYPGESNAVLAKMIAEQCKNDNVDIIEISQYGITNMNGHIVTTNKMIAVGGYQDILQLIFFIEKSKIETISSALWELVKDKNTDKYKLVATIYVKNMAYENIQ